MARQRFLQHDPSHFMAPLPSFSGSTLTITNMALAGIPEKVARQISGHRSRNVYDAYQCYEFGNVVNEAKKLEALIEQMDNTIEEANQVDTKVATNTK